jgi:hypothetical protein
MITYGFKQSKRSLCKIEGLDFFYFLLLLWEFLVPKDERWEWMWSLWGLLGEPDVSKYYSNNNIINNHLDFEFFLHRADASTIQFRRRVKDAQTSCKICMHLLVVLYAVHGYNFEGCFFKRGLKILYIWVDNPVRCYDISKYFLREFTCR